jgi:hypothetical protein
MDSEISIKDNCNASGRNRGFSLDELVLAYRELRIATGRTEPKSISKDLTTNALSGL